MDEAVALIERWARSKLPSLPGATLAIVRLPGRTPVIVIDIPGEETDPVLLYGHLDKQPEMTGRTEGYGPWIPRLEGDKLYGRGGADDGYAMFGALMALREQAIPHARCVTLIEACEESGSYEDEKTGVLRPPELYVQVPAERLTQARRAAAALGDTVYTKFPFVPGMSPMTEELTELALNRTWRPQLAVIGIDGLPTPGNAGNVLVPSTVAKLCLRLRPTLDAATAGTIVRTLLEKNPPYGARVEFEPGSSAAGWNAPALSPWLEQSLAHGSEIAFRAAPAYMGEGGSIPFMAMLGEKFPQAQFVVTGVLGPHSNTWPQRVPAYPNRSTHRARDSPSPGGPWCAIGSGLSRCCSAFLVS